MIDNLVVLKALRALADTLSVTTTGSLATLSATTAGYARSAGSFVTDGFVVGQEVTPTGFTQTTPGVVTSVSALALGINGGRTAQSPYFTFSDAFTRANSALTLGGAWSVLGSSVGALWGIDTNRAYGVVDDGTFFVATQDAGGSDVVIQTSVVVVGGGIAFRLVPETGGGNNASYYAASVNGSSLLTLEYVSTAPATSSNLSCTSVAYTYNATDVMRVTCTGAAIRVQMLSSVGAEVCSLTWTDTHVADHATRHGLFTSTGATRFDDFSVTTIVSLAVKLPAVRAWENVALDPTNQRWYVEDDYVPGPVAQIGLGALASVETFPLYTLKLYGIANTGASALYKAADALLALFAPRTAFSVGTGNSCTVRTSPAPYRGQLLQAGAGWACIPITIPLRTRAPNTY